jgi:nucleoside-diphosphate-sugar epimerase
VVQGLLAMAQTENIAGCTCDIGSGAMMSIKDTVTRVVHAMGKNILPAFGSMPDRTMEQVRKADVQKTYEKIDWKPEVNLEEGLAITIDWYSNLIKTKETGGR